MFYTKPTRTDHFEQITVSQSASLTRLPHNYEVMPPLRANQTNTKQKKDNLSIILLGGA